MATGDADLWAVEWWGHHPDIDFEAYVVRSHYGEPFRHRTVLDNQGDAVALHNYLIGGCARTGGVAVWRA